MNNPDTSRVTFGTRHPETGMVLLQHGDVWPDTWWGLTDIEDLDFHRLRAMNASVDPEPRAAHAALADVREAMDRAEADGVDVRFGRAWCRSSPPHDDDPEERAEHRARRYLAREVQALVDRGLRGYDLNAAVPYEVRDHRPPTAPTASPGGPMSIPDWHEGSRESDRVIISGLASGGRTDMWVAQVSRDGRSTWSGRHLAVFDNHEDALRVLKVVNAAATAPENSHATPNADHALDLHEGGGTSTPHGEFRPAVVVGGRYVVGENPTDSFGTGPEGLRYLAADRIVNVEDIDDSGRGACCYDDDSGHFVGYVDPRHLTPAPEPVSDGFRQTNTAEPTATSHLILDRSRQPNGEHAATCSCGATMFARTPQLRDDVAQAHLTSQTTIGQLAAGSAVDDDLLRDLGSTLSAVSGVSGLWANTRVTELLASEPMVRLFSIWTANVATQRDQYADDWEAAQARCNEYVGQIGELTTMVNRLRSREGDLEVWLQRIAEAFDMGTDDLTDEEVVSNLEELRSNRDELALRVDQQNEELGALRHTNPSTTLSAAAVEVVRALNDAGIVGDDTSGAGWPWIGKAVRGLLADRDQLRVENAELSRYHGIPSGWKLIRTDEEDRLRSAQQLPDVGPVTRHESGVPVCGGRFLNRNYGPNDFRRMAANSRENAQEELWNAAVSEQFADHLDAERRLLEAVDAEASDTSSDAPSVVCLCGSTRFRSEFVEANRALTMEGKIVVAPGVFQHDGDPLTEDEKAVLDLLHLHKIDLADEVFVVNPGGYIGDSTRREIEYARRIGKPVLFLDAETADTSRTTQAPGYASEDTAAIAHALECAQSFVDEHNEFTSDDVIRCAVRAALQHRARAEQEADRG